MGLHTKSTVTTHPLSHLIYPTITMFIKNTALLAFGASAVAASPLGKRQVSSASSAVGSATSMAGGSSSSMMTGSEMMSSSMVTGSPVFRPPPSLPPAPMPWLAPPSSLPSPRSPLRLPLAPAPRLPLRLLAHLRHWPEQLPRGRDHHRLRCSDGLGYRYPSPDYANQLDWLRRGCRVQRWCHALVVPHEPDRH